MLKTIFKNLFWIALPLGLAVGCAENRPQAEASFAPDPSEMLTPTSGRQEPQIYSSDPAIDTANVSISQPPSGANPTHWAIAEEIRQKLIADETLAPTGTSLIAEVGNDGIVTLHGSVGNSAEQKRVCDTIAGLPGVRGVDNQMAVGSDWRNRTLNTHRTISPEEKNWNAIRFQ
jgi:hypothetical protein